MAPLPPSVPEETTCVHTMSSISGSRSGRGRGCPEYNTGEPLTEGVEPMTTLDFEPLTVTVPLREEPAGVFRVGKSRVLLEVVLRAFKAGATPEAIVQSYDTLNLADVYAVVTHYLAN